MRTDALRKRSQSLLGTTLLCDAGLARISRNTPAPFYLVAPEFEVNAHDDRITVEYTAKFGIRIPANRTLEHPVISALAVKNI